MDRAQLEALALEKMSKMQAAPTSAIDRAELERLALEKLSAQGQAPIINDSEASLGFANRARFAIEPLQSNRKALLVQEYGQDNVMEDANGNLYLNQGGAFYPVNKEGFSVADVADIAGATPEMIGGAVGAVVGGVPGSVPGAIAAGTAGGALGSAARQAISGAIGTPQVASFGERAAETGISAGLGGFGSGAGQYIKNVLPGAKQGISEIIDNLRGAGKSTAKATTDSVINTVSNSAMDASGKIVPQFEKQTAKSIMGEVADQSEREVVQAEMKKLQEIAARQGLPAPTYAQAAQGKAIIAEAKILDTPLISKNVRKTYDGQLKKIKQNLENITGKFIDVDSDASEVGASAREMAETFIEANKKASQELYQQVEEEGVNAMIGKRAILGRYKNKAAELGLINPDMTRAKYAADSGFTPDTFKTLQNIMFEGIDALKANKSDKVRFEAANALRRTINGYAEELRDKNPSAARLVKQFGKELDSTVENLLEREAPDLGEKFKQANKGWAKYKQDEETLNKLLRGGNLDDEKVVKTIMSGTQNIEKMKELIGENRVKDIAKTYVRDTLKILGDSGVARADSALKKIKGPKLRQRLAQKLTETLSTTLSF
jgi:hypothetical protein